ncbi:AMP-dependent synthetase/ligase [Robertkochia flava]|uniref:AMP-dependent synthetase/ligase n=1 Tax=Robertkochia flava TaxID=3447986 RepID=UPI001CC903B8|nr:long-chain fatty acid--CoA ligase [Robertkochia marina]
MKDHTVVSIFEQINSNPKKPALALLNSSTGQWEDLRGGIIEEQIREIAAALIDHGIAPQEKVAIFAQNSIEWILTDLAIMSIGAVTVPIYATNTSKQAEYIINDAAIRLVFTGSREQFNKAHAILERGLTPLETIVSFEDTGKTNDPAPLLLSAFRKVTQGPEIIAELESRMKSTGKDDLATIIYTSGTTGEPKGVMLSHSNMVAAFDIHDKYLSFITDQDHSLSFLPLSHVFERTWTLYCLHRGLKVSVLTHPKAIMEALQAVKPTLFCTVPRLYEKIYNEIQNRLETASPGKKKVFHWAVEQGRNYQKIINQHGRVPFSTGIKKRIADQLVLNKIKDIVGGHLKMTPTAGAPLSPEIQDFLIAAGIPVTIGYGLTETTATVTAFSRHHYKIGSVGKPLEGIEIRIGKDDEILVKAPTVMKGYYNKEQETRAVFEGEWFRTGDAGRIESDGSLYITDRIKDLMKTAGGKYIVPQQTESLLTNDNFIEQAMLVAEGKPFVTALVVPNFEALKNYASQLSLDYQGIADLLNHTEIKKFFEDKINLLQEELAEFQKIKRIKLLHREFSQEEEELTPTLKIRRKIISAHFEKAIDELYASKMTDFVI